MTENPEMPFLEHVRELRRCIIRALIGVAAGSAVGMCFASEIFSYFSLPARESFANAQLIGTGPADAFLVKLWMGIFGGITLALPYLFYQLWIFVAPGLYEKERRMVLPFVVLSTVSFVSGGMFCYFLVLPVAYHFFGAEFQSIGVIPQIRIGEYLHFTAKLLIVFGIVFELPLLTYFLARLELISSRWLIDRFRYAVLTIFIVAALLTPPDVVSQLLLAAPLLVLYGLCILIARLAAPRTAERAISP